MPLFLRVEMLALAAVILAVVFRAIRRRKLSVRFSLLWLLIACGILAVAAVPSIALWLCRAAHIETPVHLVFLLGILSLLGLVFHQTELLSHQAEELRRLTQSVSIEHYLRREEDEEDEEKS